MWTLVVANGVVMVLSVFVIFSDQALQVVDGQIRPSGFAFSSFPVDKGSILTSGNSVYNPLLQSYDMTSSLLSTTCDDVTTPCSNLYCGRAMYRDKVQMIDKASSKVASFSTSFTFSFHSNETTCGVFGMAFTFAPTPNASTNISISDPRLYYGLCSFDYNDTSATNRAFAVKFHTVPVTDFDPYNTIGLVISNKGNTTVTQQNLCPYNTTNCGFFCGDKGNFTAWIDYDSAGHTIEVRFRAGSLESGGKPADAVIAVSNVVLDKVLDEEMYVGFSSSTLLENFNQVHRIRSWNFNSSGMLDLGPKSQAGLIAGICAAGVGAALMGLFVFCYLKHRNRASSQKPAQQSTPGLSTDTNSRPYTFKELSSITKNFNDSELLSSGAFGDVYKGTPPSGAPLVAVKRIRHNKEFGQATFLAEANSLRQIRHRNLLQLRGWCEAKEGMFLVYDFMSNGSLDKWLHPNPNSSPRQGTVLQELPWNVWRSILAGVASGLEYLHEGWVQCVLHRDIKSSNVMLDGNFNAYLGDFGLARLVDHRKMQKTTMLAGTLGYMAPEMHYTGKATKESDVYAFGVLVLEVVCGRRPFTDMQDGDEPGDFLLLERVWRAHEAGNIAKMVDSRLVGMYKMGHIISEESTSVSGTHSDGLIEGNLSIITSFLHLGLLCCLPNPSERPSMRLVNHWFHSSEVGAMEVPSLPAKKPGPPAGPQYNVTVMPQSSENTSSSQSSDVTRLSVQSST